MRQESSAVHDGGYEGDSIPDVQIEGHLIKHGYIFKYITESPAAKLQ
jgi:hypothetical protein